MTINSDVQSTQYTLLDALTTTQAGAAKYCAKKARAVQAKVAGTGAVSATMVVQESINGDDWLSPITITLSGTDSAIDGKQYESKYPFIRGNLTAISGTNAAATLTVGY